MRSKIMAKLGDLIATSAELTPKASGVIATPEFLRLGLTDAGLTALDHKRFRILSADLDLVVAMKKQGFEVANFQRLLFD
jgi:hypothetical protein